MDRLIKRLITVIMLCPATLLVHAQVWTKQDSLRLKKLLESDQELYLNKKAIRQIDFGSGVGTPRMSEEKNWMLPDESLPEALPKPKPILTLMPYTANTPYNWDPIARKKIKVDKNTWRSVNPVVENIRKSLAEVRTGNVRLGHSGVYLNGGAIGGLDLMTVFTKNFWDKSGRERRERTLEVLRTYGDSTTVLINKPIDQFAR